MTNTQLQIELAEARREIQRLRERVSVGAPTVHKDLSLVSLVPKFWESEWEVAALPLATQPARHLFFKVGDLYKPRRSLVAVTV